MRPATVALTASLALCGSTAVVAEDVIAAQQFNETRLGFLLRGSLSNATLSVAGPNEFHASVFSKTGALSLDLGKLGPLKDGVYTYQLTAATEEPADVKTRLDNGREADAEIGPRKSVAMSGTFIVKDGKIVTPAVAKPSRRDEPTGGTPK